MRRYHGIAPFRPDGSECLSPTIEGLPVILIRSRVYLTLELPVSAWKSWANFARDRLRSHVSGGIFCCSGHELRNCSCTLRLPCDGSIGIPANSPMDIPMENPMKSRTSCACTMASMMGRSNEQASQAEDRGATTIEVTILFLLRLLQFGSFSKPL